LSERDIREKGVRQQAARGKEAWEERSDELQIGALAKYTILLGGVL